MQRSVTTETTRLCTPDSPAELGSADLPSCSGVHSLSARAPTGGASTFTSTSSSPDRCDVKLNEQLTSGLTLTATYRFVLDRGAAANP